MEDRASLIAEKEALDARREKLRDFIASVEMGNLTDDHQALIVRHGDVLETCSHILLERIQMLANAERLKV